MLKQAVREWGWWKCNLEAVWVNNLVSNRERLLGAKSYRTSLSIHEMLVNLLKDLINVYRYLLDIWEPWVMRRHLPPNLAAAWVLLLVLHSFLNLMPRNKRVVVNGSRLLAICVIKQVVRCRIWIHTMIRSAACLMDVFISILDLILDDQVLEAVILGELKLAVVNAFAKVTVWVVADWDPWKFRVALLVMVVVFVKGICGDF